MPVIRNGRIVADDWIHLGDDDALPANGAVTVSLKRYQGERDALAARGGRLGLRLKSDERAHAIGTDASRFALIVVELPVFRDGRAFTTARLLRERYGYRGELRASGHILPDQYLFLVRCGVTSIEVKPEVRTEVYAAGLHEYTAAYQNTRSGIGTAPAMRLRSPAYALAAE